MPDMQAALRARYISDAAVTAVAGQRIYWLDRPQGSSLPAVSLQVIGGVREQHLKGGRGLRETRVQASCWASSYGAAKALAEAVIAATLPPGNFAGIRFGRSFAEEPIDLGDNATGAFIHHQAVRMTVFHYAEEG